LQVADAHLRSGMEAANTFSSLFAHNNIVSGEIVSGFDVLKVRVADNRDLTQDGVEDVQHNGLLSCFIGQIISRRVKLVRFHDDLVNVNLFANLHVLFVCRLALLHKLILCVLKVEVVLEVQRREFFLALVTFQFLAVV
jgi:hypothetical protein